MFFGRKKLSLYKMASAWAVLAVFFFAGCATSPVYVSRTNPPERNQIPQGKIPGAEQRQIEMPEQGTTRVPEVAPEEPTGTAVPDRLTPQHLASLRLVDIGKQNIESGNYDHAINVLEKAITIDSYNGYAYYYLSLAWLRKDQPSRALEFARKAELLSQGKTSQLRRVYILKGDIYKRLQDSERATRYYRKARSLEW